MNQILDELSLMLVYSAIAIYELAFIAFALDLAKRSADVTVLANDRTLGGRFRSITTPPLLTVFLLNAGRSVEPLYIGLTTRQEP